jgi:hypothetical protein
MTTFSWVLDSGGAGRGAWQGGVLYELMQWARTNGCYPKVAMGASAGGYAAADVATQTHETVTKGWMKWGLEEIPVRAHEHPDFRSLGGLSQFRSRLYHSIRYVMSAREQAGVFDAPPDSRTQLLVFTTRCRRRDGKPFTHRDSLHYFFKSSTRKLPPILKYLPSDYVEDPVIFVSHLSSSMAGEFVRPLTHVNYHNVIEASCLIPFAMGEPMQADEVLPIWEGHDPLQANACADDTTWQALLGPHRFEEDQSAVFLDGGFSLKMPFRIFAEDERFRAVAEMVRCDKAIVFCCDPQGLLWETSMRLRSLNHWGPVHRAIKERKMFVVFPDHLIEAGFLCDDNLRIMRTFERGRDQAKRVVSSDDFKAFLEEI